MTDASLVNPKRIRKTYPAIMQGMRFGKLTALDSGRLVQQASQRTTMISVMCDCGVMKLVRASSLNTGCTRSCGCGISEMAKTIAARHCVTHGMSGTPLYRVYRSMISRCDNPTVERYSRYGGRGIAVCARWRGENGFANFMSDMGPRPDGYSIERVNSDGNYEPENCRWASPKEQSNNTRRNHVIEFQGETLTIAQWSDRTGLGRSTIAFRIKAGWSVEQALTKPHR